jgi:glycosyltransferase involved in cell wall biosynthesis
MAKWLGRLGHQVTVLTTSAYGEADGEVEANVVRTADLQRVRAKVGGHEHAGALFDSDTYSGRPHVLSRVLVPEPLIAAWAPFALARALRLNRRRPFDCAITSSPPESVHAIGRALARRGVPWVADLRDGWTFESIRPGFPTTAQRQLDKRLERRWLTSADAVVCVSRPAARDLRERIGIEPHLIPNGWDPDLLTPADATGEEADALDGDRVSLVYTGRFGSYGRDPVPLVEALAELARSDPEAASRLELVVAGPLTEDEAELMRTDVSPARIVVVGSLARERALALQRAADALLLLASPGRTQLVNFKLFEYLAADRPILALAAGTEAGRIIEETGGVAVPADDVPAIAKALQTVVAGGMRPPDEAAREAYSYPATAERMADVVKLAVVHARDSTRPPR